MPIPQWPSLQGKKYTMQTITNKRTGMGILRSEKDLETRSIIRKKKELFLTLKTKQNKTHKNTMHYENNNNPNYICTQ